MTDSTDDVDYYYDGEEDVMTPEQKRIERLLRQIKRLKSENEKLKSREQRIMEWVRQVRIDLEYWKKEYESLRAKMLLESLVAIEAEAKEKEGK